MTNNELDKQWLKECRATMQHYEVPAPADGWADVVALVGAATTQGATAKTSAAPVVPMRVWLWRAAAVVVLVVLVGGGVWLGLNGEKTPMADMPSQMAALPQDPVMPAEPMPQIEPEPLAESVSEPIAKPKAAQRTSQRSNKSEQLAVNGKESQYESLNQLQDKTQNSGGTSVDNTAEIPLVNPAEPSVDSLLATLNESSKPGTSEESEKSAVEQQLQESKEYLLNAEEHAVLEAMEAALKKMEGQLTCLSAEEMQSRWSISAGVGLNNAMKSEGEASHYYSGVGYVDNNFANSAFSPELHNYYPDPELTNDIQVVLPLIPKENSVPKALLDNNKSPIQPLHVAKNSEKDEVLETSKHRVWSFGATVSILLKHRLALVSGLAYTELTTDVQCRSGMYKQKVRYLGVPLAAQYSLYQNRRLNCYASSGIMLERLLHAGRGGYKLDMNPWQWSANTALGLQVNLTRHWCLYAEPNLAYFVDNNSSVSTYRTEHPWCFSVQTGIRLRY